MQAKWGVAGWLLFVGFAVSTATAAPITFDIEGRAEHSPSVGTIYSGDVSGQIVGLDFSSFTETASGADYTTGGTLSLFFEPLIHETLGQTSTVVVDAVTSIAISNVRLVGIVESTGGRLLFDHSAFELTIDGDTKQVAAGIGQIFGVGVARIGGERDLSQITLGQQIVPPTIEIAGFYLPGAPVYLLNTTTVSVRDESGNGPTVPEPASTLLAGAAAAAVWRRRAGREAA